MNLLQMESVATIGSDSEMIDRAPKRKREYEIVNECKRTIKDKMPLVVRESCILPIGRCVDQINRKCPTISQSAHRSPNDSERILSPIEDEIENTHHLASAFFRNGLEWIATAACGDGIKGFFYIVLTELWFPLRIELWGAIRKKDRSVLEQLLIKASGDKIGASERQIEIRCKEKGNSLIGLFLENHDMEGGNYHLVQSLAEFHQDRD